MNTLRTQAFRRQTMANISATSFTISAAAIISNTAHNALINTVPSQFVAAPSNTQPWRGGRVIFFGTAGENTLHNYRAWGSWQIESSDPEEPQWLLAMLSFGQFRLSAMFGTGAARTGVLATERVADEITATRATAPTGIGEAVITSFRGADPTVYSPGNDTPAVLFLPELGNPQRCFIDLQAASGDVGVCIAADT